MFVSYRLFPGGGGGGSTSQWWGGAGSPSQVFNGFLGWFPCVGHCGNLGVGWVSGFGIYIRLCPALFPESTLLCWRGQCSAGWVTSSDSAESGVGMGYDIWRSFVLV